MQLVERVGVVLEARLQPLAVVAQPLLVGLARGQHAVDVFGAQQRAGVGVDGENLAGTQAALFDHLALLEVGHADFRGQHDGAVARDDVARGAQAVAVGGADGIAAIGEHHTGGAVPGFHLQRVVFVEGTQVGVEVFDVLPGGRDERAQGREHVHAAGEQHLEHVVEALGVGALHAHQGRHFVDVGQGRALELGRTRLRPVAVAVDGVDFAVVGEKAERMAQPPLRQGVGAEALVEDTDTAFHVCRRKVGVEHREVLGHHQALVDDDPAAQGGDVELGVALGGKNLLGAAAGLEQAQFEVELVHVFGSGDEHLLEARQGGNGLGPAGVFGVDGHHPPAGQRDAVVAASLLQHRALAGGLGGVGGHEQVAGRKRLAAEHDARLGGCPAQEARGFLHQQAAAVAGFAVGSDGTPVGHAFEAGNGAFDDVVAGHVIHLGNHPETATVALKLGPVEAHA